MSVDGKVQYPKIQIDNSEPGDCSPTVYDHSHKHVEDCKLGSSENDLLKSMEGLDKRDDIMEVTEAYEEWKMEVASDSQKLDKYFCYDSPLSEETEWNNGLHLNGGYGDFGWNESIGEDKEMTIFIEVYDYSHKHVEDCKLGSSENDLLKSMEGLDKRDDIMEVTGAYEEWKMEVASDSQKLDKYFCYDSPLSEETGIWIPVSVPPMSEWNNGLHLNGGYGDFGWNESIGEDKEMTMWDVVLDMLLTARGKISNLASGDIRGYGISRMSNYHLEQAWGELAQTLADANFGKMKDILKAEPPKWLPDSAASACMLCNVCFHPIMCSRHHCRFCGGIFCNSCSRGRSLLPSNFRTENPQRVCDACCARLESVQKCLMGQISRAAQPPIHDLNDLSTLRSWLNTPWSQTMEHEIYKATNTIQGYTKVGNLTPEKSIPSAILKQAKGLAILTVAKVGLMVTYNVGTGLVVARREDGSWSPPSAIASFGIGWGAQVGGEVTDFIIVLRTNSAVKTFSGNGHLSAGAGLSAAFGIIGRAAEADIRAGDGGVAACYTYSCSKGAFVGCSLEGNIVKTRTLENSRFYGIPSISATDILLGSSPQPPAASALYQALAQLFQKHPQVDRLGMLSPSSLQDLC